MRQESPAERPESCPLENIDVVEDHGDLIDRDKLEPDAEYDDGEFWAYSKSQISAAKVVIPHSYEKEEKTFRVGDWVRVIEPYATYTPVYPLGTCFRITVTKQKSTGAVICKLYNTNLTEGKTVILPQEDLYMYFEITDQPMQHTERRTHD